MNFVFINTVRFFLMLLLLLPSLSFGGKLNITLILSSNSDTYTITANHIKSIIEKNAGNTTHIKTISTENIYLEKGAPSETTDLFVPIGQRALKEILKHTNDTPVLASLISLFDFNNTIHNMTLPEKRLNIGAIYIDQPLKRHLLFAKLALPNIDQLGFIISSSNKHAIHTLNLLLDSDIHHIEILNPGDNIVSRLSRVMNDAGAIIALPDPIIFNLRTTRNILLSTYRKHIPIIGFSKAYVKAGALAAIYSTPELIGKQTGEYISHLIKQPSQNRLENLPRTHAKYFSISVNKRVSRSLGLPIPDEASLEKSLLQIEEGRNK